MLLSCCVLSLSLSIFILATQCLGVNIDDDSNTSVLYVSDFDCIHNFLSSTFLSEK